MNDKPGHKRKEFLSKVKSSIQKLWFNWFGDYNGWIKNVIIGIGRVIVVISILCVVLYIVGAGFDAVASFFEID